MLESIIQTADASRIPDAQNAVDRYLAIHTDEQRLFAITQLDDQVASLWKDNPTGNRLAVLTSISEYIGEWFKKIEKRNGAETP